MTSKLSKVCFVLVFFFGTSGEAFDLYNFLNGIHELRDQSAHGSDPVIS